MSAPRCRPVAAAFAAAVAAAAVLAAQAPDPKLAVLSPGQDAFVSGPTLLRARVDPPGMAASLVFFVDGRLVCTVATPPFECDWDAGPSVAEHQVRVVANLVGGGRVVGTVRTKSLGYTEKVEVDVVQVTVTVGDGHGRFVRGLPQSAFKVFEDNRPQSISHFASEDVPLELVVAIDISGSMTPAMPKLKTAVKEFLNDVPASDQVTLLGFNDNIFALTRKTTNPAERVKAVDRLAPWGSTALYDVILRGVEMLGRQTGRKALVVFTDGEDQGSHAALSDVERRLQSSDVTLYMIGQGRGVTMDSLKTVMQRLSSPTGGRALFTDSIDELHTAFADLLDELSNQYLLGYSSTNTAHDEAWRRIRVEVDGHREVRARQGYRLGATR
ncbi:MAG TPA: VWA domain-containing protein [Vicinamibacterales bacterium]|jgi:Ca-activated chloride channel family protein|nr:VWA domain-containing protein [Vicinamibacterales bacterium]